ncbi:DNA/RNA helicase domain-containing protein [Vibrio jasicida]|uniref:DNA/RNA helicase domain-containing protein n=1 Tax=Vibrio jasicida TaxID=766224 RepID=UPI004068E413
MDLSKTGWEGTWKQFLNLSENDFLTSLQVFYENLPWTGALSDSQLHAWNIEYGVMQATLKEITEQTRVAAEECWISFEQELIGEGGKRAADVNLVLPSSDLFVVEFKHKRQASPSEVTRALFDMQTMINFHSESHQLTGHCFLALTREGAIPFESSSVVCDIAENQILPKLVAHISTALHKPHTYKVSNWHAGHFNRQPSIIHGTVRVFYDNDIPNLKTEAGLNIENARHHLIKLYQHAKDNKQRYVVIVNGRPGAGKTLLGISTVADLITQHGADECKALFLSGNRPLVQVLQHTLDYYGNTTGKTSKIDGRSVIQHLVNFKKSIQRTVREENFIVFDEAQRAWEKVNRNSLDSELDVFCHWLAQKEFGVLVLLVGDGQAIHNNEMSLDGMMASYQRAVAPYRNKLTPIMPSVHAHLVNAISPQTRDVFYLETPIRQNYTDRLDAWIEAVLAGNKTEACIVAKDIRTHYPLHITGSKHIADEYARSLQSTLHEGNKRPDAFRIGWLKSSKFDSGSEVNELKDNFGPWYVDVPQSPMSCCQLQTACTEFSCQGLELSVALVEWGPDLLYRDGKLELSQNRFHRRTLDDYTFGSYRVLLSRGRTGLVVKCHDKETYRYLVDCGMLELKQS